MVKLKVRAVGTSAGVILPKEALAHMGVRRRRIVSRRESGWIPGHAVRP